MTEIPYAVDAETSLTYDELHVLELQYVKEQAQGHITTQSKFNYAWGLVKSPRREHQEKSIKIFQDIYRNEATRRRECLYYLALGYYKLGDYENARKFNNILIDKEPSNLQAQSLNTLIDKAITKEGYIGMALAGGAAALGTILIASMVRRSKK